MYDCTLSPEFAQNCVILLSLLSQLQGFRNVTNIANFNINIYVL